jgi:hypothetical protein
VLVRYAALKLIGRRRDALDAIARGFAAVTDAVGLGAPLRALSDAELGALLFGGSYVDVEALQRVLVWDAAWPVNEAQVPWLPETLARLTDPGLRVLLARATGRLQLRPDGGDSPILVLRAPEGEEEASDTPRLPGNCVLQLPAECPSPAVFEARLRAVLGLGGDYATVTRLGLGLADSRRLVRLLAPAAGIAKVFECPNGHLFGVGQPGASSSAGTSAEAQGRCPECNALSHAAGGTPKSAALLKRALDSAALGALPSGLAGGGYAGSPSVLSMSLASLKQYQVGGSPHALPGSPSVRLARPPPSLGSVETFRL